MPSAAFCETFDAPHPVPGTRSGDLDPTLWGVSRINTGHTNVSANQLNDWYAPTGYVTCTPSTYCASGTTVPGVDIGQAPNDVKVAHGRLYEAVNDGTETKTQLEIYPKQPFDWNGRTGNIVFDVSLDAQSPHAAWPEFWISDRPIPVPLPPDELWPQPKNGIGFTIAGAPGCPGLGVDQFGITTNYVGGFLPIDSQDCVSSGSHASAVGALNHIHVEITSTTMKVYATAPGSTVEKLIGSTHFPTLNFSRGLIWMSDAHYNACKFDDQCDHVFAWDNVGFDGPKTYRDYTFDVPDALTPSSETVVGDPQQQVKGLGYLVSGTTERVLTTGQSVTKLQDPTNCAVLFNATPTQGTVPDVRINGGTWIHTTWPGFTSENIYKAFDVTVPCSEVHYGTPNTISFKGNNPPGDIIVTNVNLLLVAAAPVP